MKSNSGSDLEHRWTERQVSEHTLIFGASDERQRFRYQAQARIQHHPELLSPPSAQHDAAKESMCLSKIPDPGPTINAPHAYTSPDEVSVSEMGLVRDVGLSVTKKSHRTQALFDSGLTEWRNKNYRQVTDKDAVKQRLLYSGGQRQPSRSATVIVNVAVADSFPEVLSEFTDFTHDKEYNDNLTFTMLLLALAVVSFLFITCVVVIISVKIYRWRQSRILYHSNLPVIPYYPPRYSDTLGTGTLPHVYNYDTCRTTDSKKSDIKYMQPMSQSLVSVDDVGTESAQNGHQRSTNSTLVSSCF
ncbi:hypothetical protein WMY93_009626 [Mugilogobius chulae]|uniref:Cadherin cytoplasmic C-terminal domain-containing protein n=1 Tax=Mugilogobius chulae TaxID=88201 RepID=A0AAW0PQP9_9GOBI